MKVYKEIAHLSFGTHSDSDGKGFYDAVQNSIGQMQSKGYIVEVQYSTSATATEHINSALILAYTEE